MADNKKIAEQVLAAVGGKDNVSFVNHCMTRLRFNLKDNSLPDKEGLKKIDGVIGAVESGGQFQVIIGQNVPKVYAEICAAGGFRAEAALDENLDTHKEKLTPKKIGNNILNYLAGSLTPIIPVLITAGLFKTVLAVFGPDLLGWIPATSDLYILLNFLYNAGFYFLPIYVGYAAAKKIGVTPILGMFMGGILIAPGLLKLATEGTAFTVFGIPASVHNYTQTVLPILLTIWVMSYVERFFKKHVPETLSTIFTPFLTITVMVPLSLCLLAPAGTFVGDYIAKLLVAFGDFGGFVAVVVVAMLWEYLVMSGMHVVLVITAMTTVMAGGNDPLFLTAGHIATWAACGMALGAFLRIKNRDEKAISLGYFISGLIGGVTEPVLYGVGLKYKRPFIGMSIGAGIGGLYAGLTHVSSYLMASSNFLGVLRFSGSTTANLLNGTIACVISMLSSAAAVYLMGFGNEKKKAA